MRGREGRGEGGGEAVRGGGSEGRGEGGGGGERGEAVRGREGRGEGRERGNSLRYVTMACMYVLIMVVQCLNWCSDSKGTNIDCDAYYYTALCAAMRSMCRWQCVCTGRIQAVQGFAAQAHRTKPTPGRATHTLHTASPAPVSTSLSSSRVSLVVVYCAVFTP